MTKYRWTAYRWAGVLGVALLLPMALVAQTDQGLPSPNGPQDMGSMPSQTDTGSSMRESLGAPGQTGQQMLDREFMRTAAEEGIADVRMGELAMQRGGPVVKPFAQQIVADHVAIDKDMDAIADSLGVQVPTKMSKDDQAEYNRLNGLSGNAFDTEYVTFVLQSHWKKLHDYYMEASVAADPGLAAEVVTTMRVMHTHLAMIRKVAAEDGITLPQRPRRPSSQNAASTAPATKP